jgi:hypothetical protein
MNPVHCTFSRPKKGMAVKRSSANAHNLGKLGDNLSFLRHLAVFSKYLKHLKVATIFTFVARWHLVVMGYACCLAQPNANIPSAPFSRIGSSFKISIEHKLSLGLSVRKDAVSIPITSSVSAELSFGEKKDTSRINTSRPASDSLAIWHIKDLTMMIGEIDAISVSCANNDQLTSIDNVADRESVQEEINSVRKHLRSELSALIRESQIEAATVAQMPLAPEISFTSTDIVRPTTVSSAGCEKCTGHRSLWTRGMRLTTNLVTASRPSSSPFAATITSITAGVSLPLHRRPSGWNKEDVSTRRLHTLRQSALSNAIGELQTNERVSFLRQRIDQLRIELRSEACNSSIHSKWLHEKYILYLVEFYHAKRSIFDRALDSAQLR